MGALNAKAKGNGWEPAGTEEKVRETIGGVYVRSPHQKSFVDGASSTEASLDRKGY